MNAPVPETHVIAEVMGRVGCITLNRPKALNALSLDMIRSITQALEDWKSFRIANVAEGSCTVGHWDLLALPR